MNAFNPPMKAQPYSLVRRLSAVLSFWICSLWFATSLGVAWYMNDEIGEGFDSALVESAHRLIDLAEHEVRELDNDIIKKRLDALNRTQKSEPKVENDYLMYQVLDATGEVLMHSIDAPKRAMKTTLELGFYDTEKLRMFTFKHPTEPLFIHVADPLKHRNEARNETLLWLLLPLLGIFPLLMFVVRRTVASVLQPISEIAADIQRRSETDLTPIATHTLPEELKVIAVSNNHLFEQLKTALDTERILAAQAAHELRTPLATAYMHLAGIAQQDIAACTKHGLTQAMDSLKKLTVRTEKLLQMSRAQGGTTWNRKPLDICKLVGNVTQTFWLDEAVARRLHLKLLTNVDEVVTVMGDYDTIAIALRNLIENALCHTPQGMVWVQVSTQVTQQVDVSVSDNGTGVDTDTLKRLQTDFSQTTHGGAGHGLGLSIVKAIAKKHDAVLQLCSPASPLGGGFKASLIFKRYAII
jgi:two-component system, OmpR family, sensor kinase